ncbi:MAG TPA: protein kinase [Blastocatellia bacterium]|nr:protein kinase [Blastocatellia bacterium]
MATLANGTLLPNLVTFMEQARTNRVRLGGFELDLRTGELYPVGTAGGDGKILLREQPFQVLRMLIERKGKIVTREEIKRKLWPNDTIVDFDHSINVAIGTLRRALGDSANNPQYIETLARRGYRLRVAIEWMETTRELPLGDAASPPALVEPGGLIGKKVSHYRVLEVIGGGGMGMVYKAEDLKLNRPVALKFLPEELASDPIALQRFEREAQTASALNHPNICTIYEIEEYEGKRFIAMELLEGDTLLHRVNKAKQNANAIAAQLDIAIQICNGLQAAHDKDIIHRDIKPANIFLTKEGVAKILDFGLAKLVAGQAVEEKEDAEESPLTHPPAGEGQAPGEKNDAHPPRLQADLTRTGTTAGTAAYMSPEQVRKEKLDARTDLFSFGLVLYEMVSGRRAFDGETIAEVNDAILSQTPTPAHDLNHSVPRKLDVVIRKALEKDRSRRYQSVAEMREDIDRVRKELQPARRRARRWKAAGLGAFAVLLGVVGFASWRYLAGMTPPSSQRIMLAVLPFENLTGDPNKEYFADGLTEEMISQLARLNPDQLGVIARTSVMGYKNKDIRLDQIGRDLSVQYVLENSVRESGDQIRLTAQLIQVKDQTHLWSHDYDYSAKDVLVVQDDVAKAVAREVQLRLTSQQQAKLAQTHPVNPEAFEAYFQGRYLGKDPDVAAKYFERATQLDPNYALAWVWLSRARFRQTENGRLPPDEGRRFVREAAERALALDPNLADAHIQMGTIKQIYDFDWAGGNASIQRALALEPANPAMLAEAANSAATLGRFDESLKLVRRAVELDPLNARLRLLLGQIEYWMGALDEAVADLKRGLELNPQAPGHIFLAEIYVKRGRSQDALAEIEQMRTGSPFSLQEYAIAYHALGREKESDAALQELITKHQTIAAFQIAEVYAFRDQSDKAFEWLDRAYAQRDGGVSLTSVEPLLKNLHGDPRYTAFLKKLNLPT